MSESKKANILFLFHYTDMNNGAVRSMVDVIETLVRKYGANITVVYPSERASAIDYLEKMGVHTYHIQYGRLDYKLNDRFGAKAKAIAKQIVKYGIALSNMKKFKAVIEKEKIDIVYSNTATVYMGALISKKYDLPHIWHIREFGKEDHGIGFLFGEKKLYKKMNDTANAVIYISKSIQNKYSKYLDDKVKQYVVYNDISPKFVNPKAEYNADPSEPVNVAIIGSLQKGKGQLEVIKAIELLRQRNAAVKLHIGGRTSGEYYEQLSRYVKEHNLEESVVFDGFIRDTNTYRAGMDIGVVASSSEAFGRVTVEGMLSTMAMIGADSAGTSELIEDGKTGLLYELGNTQELADKIEALYKDRALMKQLALSGFDYATENFTQGRAAGKIYEIIVSEIVS